MKKFNIAFFLAFILLAFGCSKKKQTETPTYNNGSLTVTTDESFKSVTEALAEGYMMNYPDTKINVKTQKEDFGFLDLLRGKNSIVVMSRELNIQEKKEFERILDLKILPSKFAADAVVFVVPKNSAIQKISLEDIKNGLLSNNKKFIFDNTNASNLNFVAQKINKKPSELQFSILDGNVNVIKELSKFPDKIGVIGLNTISREYDKTSQDLKSQIKILPIEVQGKLYEPSSDNLKDMTYPFTRVLYFLTSEGNFGIANGFIRFSCTHLGQMIVQKEGLQRYHLYKREVQMR